MTNIKEIADEIYSKDNTKSPNELVDIFERHQKVIENIDYEASQEIYDIYSRLIADYGISLADIGKYKKALPVIEKAFNLLLNNQRFTPDTLHKVRFYEVLIFNRGVCNYYMNRYKSAKPDFKLLVELYPDNIIYPKWVKAIEIRKLYTIKNILWYFALGSVLTETFFTGDKVIKDVALGVGLVTFLGAIIFEAIIYFSRKKAM